MKKQMKQIVCALTAAIMVLGGTVSIVADENTSSLIKQVGEYTSGIQPHTDHLLIITANNVRFWTTPGGVALGQIHRGAFVMQIGRDLRVHNGRAYMHVEIVNDIPNPGANGNEGRTGWVPMEFIDLP